MDGNYSLINNRKNKIRIKKEGAAKKKFSKDSTPPSSIFLYSLQNHMNIELRAPLWALMQLPRVIPEKVFVSFSAGSYISSSKSLSIYFPVYLCISYLKFPSASFPLHNSLRTISILPNSITITK